MEPMSRGRSAIRAAKSKDVALVRSGTAKAKVKARAKAKLQPEVAAKAKVKVIGRIISKPTVAIEVWSRLSAAQRQLKSANYYQIYKMAPLERIEVLKHGILASLAKTIVADLEMPAASVYQSLDVPISTINRKAKAHAFLSQDEGERVLGLVKLVGQVEAMLEGAEGFESFDARAWTSRWLSEPQPALGGRRPLELLDTMEGQALVSDTLSRIESGAYG